MSYVEFHVEILMKRIFISVGVFVAMNLFMVRPQAVFAATCSLSPANITAIDASRAAIFSWDLTGDVADPSKVHPDISCSGVGIKQTTSDKTGKDSFSIIAFDANDSGTETCTVNGSQCSATMTVEKKQTTTDPCASGGTGTCETPVSLACPDSRAYLGASLTCANLGGNPGKICCKTASGGGGSGGSGASGSGSKLSCQTGFISYAGVCFPTSASTGLSQTSVAKIITNLMKWLLYLFGFLAIIAFIISGIQYLTATGNMNVIETAKRNMNYSVIGVIVALSGLVILIAVDALLKGTGWGS